jgi:AbrB family looped-hinge helix DNA binding protein
MRIGPQGRAVIPASIRKELGLRTGDTVAVRVEGGRVVIESRKAVLERLLHTFDHVPKTRSLSRELLAERRREARREAAR